PVPLEELERSVGERLRGTSMLGGVAGEEMLRQVADVLAPVAQRRQLDGDHLQAPEEVLAEPSFLDEFRKVAVGGADHAQVEQDGLLSADPLDLVLLQRPEDLRLEIQRQL